MLFLNLTNGIEAIKQKPDVLQSELHFIRIQSTWCEQKRWKDIILDLDYTFLLACRVAPNVCVIDYSATKLCPRAIYQGLPWIQYCLNRYWYAIKDEPVFVKNVDCRKYFEEQYNKLLYEKTAELMFQKLKYFRKFTGTGKVLLLSVSDKTKHDGDYKFYDSILKNIRRRGKL